MRISGVRSIGLLMIMLSSLWWAGCGQTEETAVLELEETDPAVSEEPEDTEEERTDRGVIVVHVCGCVNQPGVYELTEGSRLYEAIDAAGGAGAEAAVDYLNQAAIAEDGQQIYVPSLSEVEEGTASPEGMPGNPEDGKVNLNTADAEELMTLTGIGEAKAEAILRYREEKGGFRSVEELMEVDGIKEGVFNKIKDQIKV